MILVNRTAHNYRWKVNEFTSTRSWPASPPLVAGVTFIITGTFGEPYADSAVSGVVDHGWRIEFTNKIDHGVESYVGFLRFPSLGVTHNFSGAGWISPFDIYLKGWLSYLTVTDCDSYTAGGSDLELFILGVSDWTYGGAWTEGGTGFSPDDNTLYAEVFGFTSLDGAPLVDCVLCPSAPYPGESSDHTELTWHLDFGWDHNPSLDDVTYIEERMSLDTSEDPPAVSCTTNCYEPLEKPFDNSPETCGHMILEGTAGDDIDRVKLGTGNAYCDGVFSYAYNEMRDTRTWLSDVSIGWADPVSNTNRKTRDDAGARCWNSGGTPAYTTSGPTDTVQTEAKARWYAGVEAYQFVTECREATSSPPICFGVMTFDWTPATCTACGYQAYAERTWIDSNCGCTEKESPSDDAHEDWHHIRAFKCVTNGHIYVGLRQNPAGSSWSDNDTAISGTAPDIRWRRGALDKSAWLWYESAGSILERYSIDLGGTFSMPTTITSAGTPKNPRGIETLDRNRIVYWVDGTDVKGLIRDRAGTTLKSVFTAVSGIDANSAIAARDYVDGQGQWRCALQVIKGGDLYEYSSIDGTVFT